MTMTQKRGAAVHLLSVGAFGSAVAEHLRTFHSEVSETPVVSGKAAQPESWPDARMHVIAAWRPVVDLCGLLDDICHERKKPFVPVILDSTALRVGPVVVPGHGSCWGCWIRRYRQHAVSPQEESALWQHYATNPDIGPHGYLEPFATMAAARTAQIIWQLNSSAAIGGSVWQIDMLTREITTSTVVGVHGCPRCGLNRPEQTRSFAELHRTVSYLWENANGKQR